MTFNSQSSQRSLKDLFQSFIESVQGTYLEEDRNSNFPPRLYSDDEITSGKD